LFLARLSDRWKDSWAILRSRRCRQAVSAAQV
jgi:hypothetical protein